eukprot:13955554-Heterocapsa_arctica.AAC.1
MAASSSWARRLGEKTFCEAHSAKRVAKASALLAELGKYSHRGPYSCSGNVVVGASWSIPREQFRRSFTQRLSRRSVPSSGRHWSSWRATLYRSALGRWHSL